MVFDHLENSQTAVPARTGQSGAGVSVGSGGVDVGVGLTWTAIIVGGLVIWYLVARR